MKVFEKVLKATVGEEIHIDNTQFGFMPGWSTIDAIFIMRQIQEKYREKGNKVYNVFVDLEKAFDKIPKEVIRWVLQRQMLPEHLVRLAMTLYVDTTLKLRTMAGNLEECPIKVVST